MADPDNRELRLACGAALLNLRLAVAALGRQPEVTVLADAAPPWCIATLRPGDSAPVFPDEAALAAAIPRRRTNRRPFAEASVPRSTVQGGARSTTW